MVSVKNVRFSIGNRGSSIRNLSRKQRLGWGSILLLIGLALSGYGYMNYQSQGEALDNAVNVTGTVTGTEIVRDSGGRRSGPDYSPVISFEYQYQGESYSSDNMYPPGDTDQELDSRSSAEEVVENYPVDSEADAYVNPEDPGEAFLKKKRSDGPLLMMGIGGALMFGAVYVIMRP